MLHAVLNKSWKQYPTKRYTIYVPPYKPSIYNKQDMLGTIGVVRKKYGLLLMDTPVLGNQERLTYIISVQMLDVV